MRKMMLCAAMVLGFGCSANADPGPGTNQQAVGGSPDGMVTRTVVHLSPDGKNQVHVVKLTMAEAQADRAEREAARSSTAKAPASSSDSIGKTTQAIYKENCSVTTALWMYEEASCPSSPWAEICFDGTGTEYFGGFRFWGDTGPYWAGKVLSYWPGQYSGSLISGSFKETFVHDTACTSAGSVGKSSDTVCLGSGC